MSVALSRKLPHLPAEASENRKSGDVRFHFLLLTVAVVLGAALQAWGPAWSRGILEQVRLDSFSGLSTLLLAFLASMFAHEFGHLFAALLMNYEVLGGAIGPFRIDWLQNKATVRFEPGDFSRCFVSAVPREMRNGWRGRMLIVVVAGPLVSLLFAVVSTNVALRGHDASWLTSFWSSCAEVNFFVFVLGLVPNGRFAAVRNDAALFCALWENKADALDIFMCHQAIELSLRRIRPEDYPESLLLELASFQGRPYTNLMVAQRVVEWAADSGNAQLAGEWQQAAVDAATRCSPRLANCALAESACFDLLFHNNLPSAIHKFAQVEFAELFPPSLAERARAARLIACGLPHRAPAHILRAQYHLPLANQYYNYERVLLDKLHMKALLQCRPNATATMVF